MCSVAAAQDDHASEKMRREATRSDPNATPADQLLPRQQSPFPYPPDPSAKAPRLNHPLKDGLDILQGIGQPFCPHHIVA